MRFPLENLSSPVLPVSLSVMLFAATASFGQAPAAHAAPVKPHPAIKAQPPHGAPAVHPFAPPQVIVDQLKKIGGEQKARWDTLLRALKLAVNLLSGNETNLLSGNRPELLSNNKAALLSGNSPELLSGNSPKLLSDNKPNILSGNQTPILSGNRISLSILSGLKIEIHIENSGNHNPPLGPHQR
ncbi:MAG: hypothetical protein IT426_02250 [Pirellulales bacterium]|nr:hypothetical protein [Pirellulales bacterium]